MPWRLKGLVRVCRIGHICEKCAALGSFVRSVQCEKWTMISESENEDKYSKATEFDQSVASSSSVDRENVQSFQALNQPAVKWRRSSRFTSCLREDQSCSNGSQIPEQHLNVSSSHACHNAMSLVDVRKIMLPVVEVSCESSRSLNQLTYGLAGSREERESFSRCDLE